MSFTEKKWQTLACLHVFNKKHWKNTIRRSLKWHSKTGIFGWKLFSFLDCRKVAYPQLNEINSSLKSIKSCSLQRFFSSCVQGEQPFLVWIEKIIEPYLRYPKSKQWENLIIQLQPQGTFLLYIDSTCLNDSIVIKIKKPYKETLWTRYLLDLFFCHSSSLDT